MRKIHINYAPDNAELARPIFTENGKILLGSGVKLTSQYKNRLQSLGIDYVYIEDELSEGIETEDVIHEQTRRLAVETVNKTLTQLIDHPQIITKKNLPQIGDTYRRVFQNIINDLKDNEQLVVNLANIQTNEGYLFHHSVNVAILAGIVGLSLGYNSQQLLDLGVGALLHDIGMTQIPKEIWLKQGILSKEEEEVVAKHTTIGFDILRGQHDISLLSAHVAFQHHERFNGTGYPRKLTGENIHEYARIVAIADVYDSLTNNNSFRKRLTPSEAIEFLYASGNSLFDQKILKVFTNYIALYPISATVLLSTKQVGIVSQIHQDYPTRPTIRLIKEADGKEIKPPIELDLRKNLNVTIIKEI